MKKITIPPGIRTIAVADVFRLMLDQAIGGRIRIAKDRDGKTISHTQGGLVLFDELQRQFLEFCRLKNVSPARPEAPWTYDYDGSTEKNRRYHISIDDFQTFASAYGFDVSIASIDSSNVLDSTSVGEMHDVDESNDWDLDDVPNSLATTGTVQEKTPRIRSRIATKPPSMVPAKLAAKRISQSKSAHESHSKDPKIPGKLPRAGSGRMAVKAAWQIEIETERAADRKAVMARLQEWADNGSEPSVLLRSDKAKRAVEWITCGGKTKSYDLGACEKTLAEWNRTRLSGI